MGNTVEFPALLAAALKRKTQREVAERLGVDEATIRRWKRSQGNSRSHLLVPALREIVESRRGSRDQPSTFKFVDLFAGIGGIRIPFEELGGQCVFTSEWDSNAQKTYAENFSGDEHSIHGDITQIPADAIPDHDLLLAGFPCQPFSIAGVSKKNALGRPHGFECTTQGTLFFDVARIISEKKPAAFLLENVKNLRSHDGGNTFRVMIDTLERELNYTVTARVIDAKHFVPQHRERILIAGFRENAGFDLSDIQLPSATHTLSEILHSEDGRERDDVDGGRYIDDRGNVHDKYRLSTKLWEYLKAYAQKHREAGNGFGYGKVFPTDIARTLSARYYKDGSEILVDRGRGNPRRLTPRECARLMGFPSGFKIVVSDTQAYRQFGNSVAVPVIRHVARHLVPFLVSSKDQMSVSAPQLQLFRGTGTG